MSKKGIYEKIVGMINDVPVVDRFNYRIFLTEYTWNKITNEQRQELKDVAETELRCGVQFSPYLNDNRIYLVNTRLFSPDIKEINI